MNVSPALAALSAAAAALLVASFWTWTITIARLTCQRNLFGAAFSAWLETALKGLGILPRSPLVPFSPRRPVPWAVVDLLALIGIYVLSSLAAAVILRESKSLLPEGSEGSPLTDQITLIVGNLFISLLIVVVGLPLVAFRTKGSLRDFGWSLQDSLGDLKLGLIGFVMLVPPVYVLQGVLIYFWQPSKHPLMEMFKETPDIRLFGLLFVSAAVVAPLFEELIFRVVLQGFLEKAFGFRGEAHELFFGYLAPENSQAPPAVNEEASVTAAATISDAPKGALNPYASPTVLTDHTVLTKTSETNSELQGQLRGVQAWLPILISSAIFALLHFSHGPDWIPLFLLAAGLGYLYQRTHRLLPSLVVHASLNAMSMWGLWVQVQEGLSAKG